MTDEHRPAHGDAAHVAAFDDLVDEIIARPGPVRLVAVDGPGGAGKSTFAARLARSAGGAPVVHTDDFATAEEPIEWWPRLQKEVIEPITDGRPRRYRRYDWIERSLAEWVAVEPFSIVIIEGVSSGRDEWSDDIAYTVWVETRRDTRLRRGLDRDGEQMMDQWTMWMAAEDAHFASDGASRRADIKVDGQPTLPHDPDREFIVLSRRG
jgi:uridine kinase